MTSTIPTRTHPLTGAPIVPLGFRSPRAHRGETCPQPIWPIMGGSGEGGDGGGEGGSGAEGGSGGDQGGQGGGAQGGDQSGSGGDEGGASGDGSPWDDPAKAKSEIERLRRENGADRTKAKEDAAKEAREAMAKEIGKAIGLVDSDKAPTVEDLTKQLADQTSQTQEAAAVARDTQAELVVWQNAKDLGVDAAALTDSRAFAAAIKDLDPTNAKFAEDVKKAAQAAAEQNPKLKATQGADSSSADHSGGSGGGGAKQPQSLNDAVAGHYGTA